MRKMFRKSTRHMASPTQIIKHQFRTVSFKYPQNRKCSLVDEPMKFSIPKRYNDLRSIDFLAKILPQKFYQSNIVSDIALLIKQNALCATVSTTVTSKKAPSINDVISFPVILTPLSPPCHHVILIYYQFFPQF